MAQQATVIAPENRPGNVKFEKIWNRAKDCDVASVLLHVNGTVLCMDKRHALTVDEVIDCCMQGCIVHAGNGKYYRPVYWGVSGGVVTVVCLDNSGTSGALEAKVFTSYQAS